MRFHFLYRPPNKDGFDIRKTQDNGIFSGECKNHEKNISASLLTENIIPKIPDGSKLHMLFCTKLANFKSMSFVFFFFLLSIFFCLPLRYKF